MRLYLNENAASMENNIVYYEKLNKIFDFNQRCVELWKLCKKRGGKGRRIYYKLRKCDFDLSSQTSRIEDAAGNGSKETSQQCRT